MRKELLTENFYQKLILEPIACGCDEIVGVSGYISSAFLETVRYGGINNKNIKAVAKNIVVDITYGMYPSEGVTLKEHEKVKKLTQDSLTSIRYYNPSKISLPSECHSKVIVCLQAGRPKIAFCGSLNWSSSAFFSTDREAVVECDPEIALKYVHKMQTNSLDCNLVRQVLIKSSLRYTITETKNTNFELEQLLKVELPLTAYGKGKLVPLKSGLNWGMRGRRNLNEAYISVPAEIGKSGFFPPRGARFTIYTDDGESFACVIAQDGDKAIETVESNAILGEYFRRRLGVTGNVLVTIDHLKHYGRIDVTIAKLPNGDYFLDLRPKM